MKLASIVGARPNFIKLAPLSRELRKERELTEIIIHTGQHYDYEMDRIFFDELGIPAPDYHLGIGSGLHGQQTGAMLEAIEKVLLTEHPDLVLVFGDTNTTLAGALAAAKLYLPVAHVEAGLRSFDRRMPEEVNRVLVDHCSDLLFCPTRTAVENLKREGITEGVHLTGDVMVDIMAECIASAERQSHILSQLDIASQEFLLATVHRAENTDDPRHLHDIVKAFCNLGERLIFPCHPRTEARLKATDLWNTLTEHPSIRVIPPVGYLDMLVLEQHARKILTDSGGVQKEAYMLKVPCITLRDTTEWVETVTDGWNVLVGSNSEAIVQYAREFVPSLDTHTNVFGASTASREITRIISNTHL